MLYIEHHSHLSKSFPKFYNKRTLLMSGYNKETMQCLWQMETRDQVQWLLSIGIYEQLALIYRLIQRQLKMYSNLNNEFEMMVNSANLNKSSFLEFLFHNLDCCVYQTKYWSSQESWEKIIKPEFIQEYSIHEIYLYHIYNHRTSDNTYPCLQFT